MTTGQFAEGRPSYEHWRGGLTRGGEVGPAGATALLVRDIVTVRQPQASDCSAP